MATQFQVINKKFDDGSNRECLTDSAIGWKVGNSVKFPACGLPFKITRVRNVENSEVRRALTAVPENRTPLEREIVAAAKELLPADELAAILAGKLTPAIRAAKTARMKTVYRNVRRKLANLSK